MPIGHISWDPRNAPEYVQIGHNCILPEYKGNGYGKRQLQEAIHRIQHYHGLNKIIDGTNRNLIAPHNYESVGFKLCQIRKNESDASFSGDYLDYEMFVLDDNGIKAECVITKKADGVYELKNIAVLPDCQRKVYGKSLIEFLVAHYSECNVL